MIYLPSHPFSQSEPAMAPAWGGLSVQRAAPTPEDPPSPRSPYHQVYYGLSSLSSSGLAFVPSTIFYLALFFF